MTEIFACDDKEQLVAYLYDELDGQTRARVDEHVRRCDACMHELAGLGGVRRELAGWEPPDTALGFAVVSTAAARPRAFWREVPAWAHAAAAVLVMGVGLAVANVQLRYDDSGIVVTTGWMAPSPAAEPAPATMPVATPASDEAWRAEMAALERRVLDAIPSPPPVAMASAREPVASVDAEALFQRVTTLIEESELRQRQELAYRLTQFNRDMELQRRADLVRIERGVGQIEGRMGAEGARQREMLNYLVRASQRPQ